MTPIFLLTLFLLYIGGLMMVLFISPKGWILSLVAFFTMCVVLILKGRLDIFEGTNSEAWISLNSLRQMRRYTTVAIPILGILFLASLVAVFSQPGVCETDNLPLLVQRDHYVLVNHRNYTEVGPLRYYVAGLGFLAGWNSIMLISLLEASQRYIQKEIYRREG
jgi:hypothetical protein